MLHLQILHPMFADDFRCRVDGPLLLGECLDKDIDDPEIYRQQKKSCNATPCRDMAATPSFTLYSRFYSEFRP